MHWKEGRISSLQEALADKESAKVGNFPQEKTQDYRWLLTSKKNSAHIYFYGQVAFLKITN